MSKTVDTAIIGGGMITNDLILPAVYHLQRAGVVGGIHVCALNNQPLTILQDNPEIRDAFPGQDFTPWPDMDQPPDRNYPEIYKEALEAMPPYSVAIIALPDQIHYQVVMEALERNMHVLCVKPLVLTYEHSVEIERTAREKGLFVGVEYHKRFDRRSLVARQACQTGKVGEFVMGEAKMIEPYYYRNSNFQNWFTTDQTDPFTYVGCHYVDLVNFITGLKPVSVSVAGVIGKFPNGNEGYMWANGRVRFENDALLNVTDGLGYPDAGAGPNEQGLSMFFEGDGAAGIIKHDDQFRGVIHSYPNVPENGGAQCKFVNPDFYRLVSWEGEGLKPVGYGFDSIAATINTVHRMESVIAEEKSGDALQYRQKIIDEADAKGIIATPKNSAMNALVMEAARMSIVRDGANVQIVYGDAPHVTL